MVRTPRIVRRSISRSKRAQDWFKRRGRWHTYQASSIEVQGTREHGGGGSLYGTETLTIRMPETKLPCGLHAGDPVENFIAKLGPPYHSEAVGQGRLLSYDWDRYTCHGDLWWAEHANIDVSVAADLTIESVRWYYFAD